MIMTPAENNSKAADIGETVDTIGKKLTIKAGISPTIIVKPNVAKNQNKTIIHRLENHQRTYTFDAKTPRRIAAICRATSCCTAINAGTINKTSNKPKPKP